jgi:hypothetical protein
MKSTDITIDDVQMEQTESRTIADFKALSRTLPREVDNARMRYALMGLIILVLAWLTFTTISSIREIENELDEIRSSMVVPRW